MMRTVFVSLTAFLVTLGSGILASAEPASFKVIVNPSVAGRAIPREVLAQIYLGKVERWANGTVITPVDLSSTSPVRRSFSDQVLGLPVEAVRYQWLKRVTSGQRPPLSKSSDDEVIAFVASQPGSVGYVSAEVAVPAGVREVGVQ
jgi:ABC-type phosphate transport system substrate-binding protein